VTEKSLNNLFHICHWGSSKIIS